MTQNEIMGALVVVAWIAYTVGRQHATRAQVATQASQAPADPLAWLGSWAQS
jgi:hypothetical protein